MSNSNGYVEIDGVQYPVMDADVCECEPELIDYSTQEQFTGRYWIDGGKIYEKTVVLNDFQGVTARQWAVTPHGIENMHYVVDLKAMFNNVNRPSSTSGHGNAMPISCTDPAASTQTILHCRCTRTSIDLRTDNPALSEPGIAFHATVQYTCTDR